jgi:hypothetical protein
LITLEKLTIDDLRSFLITEGWEEVEPFFFMKNNEKIVMSKFEPKSLLDIMQTIQKISIKYKCSAIEMRDKIFYNKKMNITKSVKPAVFLSAKKTKRLEKNGTNKILE